MLLLTSISFVVVVICQSTKQQGCLPQHSKKDYSNSQYSPKSLPDWTRKEREALLFFDLDLYLLAVVSREHSRADVVFPCPSALSASLNNVRALCFQNLDGVKLSKQNQIII